MKNFNKTVLFFAVVFAFIFSIVMIRRELLITYLPDNNKTHGDRKVRAPAGDPSSPSPVNQQKNLTKNSLGRSISSEIHFDFPPSLISKMKRYGVIDKSLIPIDEDYWLTSQSYVVAEEKILSQKNRKQALEKIGNYYIIT